MSKQTSLYDRHVEAGARITEFSGWDMPLHYGSVIKEHLAVREHAGVFDVSHMTFLDAAGDGSLDFLRYLLANDAGRLTPGQALYSLMLNESGGVLDDLIVYRLGEDRFRLVLNCATREKDLAWIEQHAGEYQVQLQERDELAMLAVHGPESIGLVCTVLGLRGFSKPEVDTVRGLEGFRCLEMGGWFIAHTGYTGETGLELMLTEDEAQVVWDALLALDVQPVGLGARDTLRLEAGMNLYGQDMDESVSPFSANLGWTIAWEPASREFIGRGAVEAQHRDFEQGLLPRQAGLVLEERGVLRHGQSVVCEGSQDEKGIITSGGFSPTLNHSIALARIPHKAGNCRVDLRGKLTPVKVVRPCFVRHGKSVL